MKLRRTLRKVNSSSSGAEDGNESEEDMEVQEVDDDENTPMKPGEEVPPLDTKYLPIFEALHERGKVLTKPEKTYLVNMTGMTYRQITIWFQNRRRGELKEDLQLHASSSHAASVHSLDSSDASEDGIDLEQRFSNVASDTTFDIRSWRLTSALPAKNSLQGSSFPSSPTKLTFGSSATISGSDTDDTDLSDLSDDEANLPPGLQVPSLSTSFTTADTASLATSRSLLGPTIPVQNTSSGVSLSAISRPVKPLPPSRRTSPQARGQRAPAQHAPAFSFNFAGSASAPAQNQFLPTSAPMPAQPAQFVTSNERGLTVEMDTTPPTSVVSLQSSSAPPAPATNSFANSSISAALLPSSPPLSAGSPHSASSPTPPAQSASSPRPAVKPLPRRTGCAPRPRPPPRVGSVSTPATTPAPASTSARSSVVLPPSSNPSLGNTTLGALLRPNPPAPKIPTQMEDRLSAMAGRMGVGSSSNLARRSTATDVAALARASISPDASSFPTRGSSFAFGPATLPGIHALSGPTLAPVSGQQTQSPRSPSS
ncbi:hypothetical protein BDV93DRAFT_120648 [Ceratobasidium sp. AG-I]|nr:hypothetical protein BDV93DRAFT_120648 [Ceratobasidium sp. AG-I]